jgi:hypothetical protein
MEEINKLDTRLFTININKKNLMNIKSLKNKIHSTVLFFCLIGTIGILTSWGTFGHEHINHSAVLALPKPLQLFFYNHIDYITQESTVPDLRKYTLNDKAERPRHFIDLENYGIVDSIPKSATEAHKKYDTEFMAKNGSLPWYIQEMMIKLTKAFKEKRKTEILFLAADLGHYIGDANMPLHTSINHNGQLTDQKGIHALWEAQIPEMFGNNYHFNVEKARYIDDIEAETWQIILQAHQLVEPLLLADKNLRNTMLMDNIFVIDSQKNTTKNKFNDLIFKKEYVQKFNESLNGMVEKQMRKAIQNTTDFWFTAWVNAGKPDLSDLDTEELTQSNQKNLRKELNTLKKGKLLRVKNENEF